jgi:hypothetical protein
MTPIIRTFALIVVLAGLSPTAAVAAQQFNYSYTFGSGHVASGSFWGDSNGTYVENLYDITLLADGVPLNGSPNLYASSYTPATGWQTGARVYFSLTPNFFIFSESDFGSGNFNRRFDFVVQTDFGAGYVGLENLVTNNFIYDCTVCTDGSPPVDPARWSLTAAVPEPETYAMMLAGLGSLGFVARRRKQKTA